MIVAGVENGMLVCIFTSQYSAFGSCLRGTDTVVPSPWSGLSRGLRSGRGRLAADVLYQGTVETTPEQKLTTVIDKFCFWKNVRRSLMVPHTAFQNILLAPRTVVPTTSVRIGDFRPARGALKRFWHSDIELRLIVGKSNQSCTRTKLISIESTHRGNIKDTIHDIILCMV